MNTICNQAHSLLRRNVFTEVELDHIRHDAARQSLDSSSVSSVAFEEEYSETSVEISVHDHDLMLASPTAIFATPPATCFTEYEQQLFNCVCENMQSLSTNDLCIMPNLKPVPFTQLKKITKVVDRVLAYYKVISFTEVLKLLYCGARVVT